MVGGGPLGLAHAPPLPDCADTPFEALESTVAGAIRGGACFVACSGGLDSSLILAAAVRTARTLNAPTPVAVSLRYPTIPSTDETHWQELVLDHLGSPPHIVIEITRELDLVAPEATAQLERHGVRFPANSHSLVPLLSQCSGGTLLLGLGGDEVLGNHHWTRLNDALAGRRRRRPRDLPRLIAATSPSPIRAAVIARRDTTPARAWLRPAAARQLAALERRAADEPLRFDRAVAASARLRYLAVARATLEHLGAEAGVRIETPLLHPRFVSALGHAGGARGWGDRGATVRAIAEGTLPGALLERRDKAVFTRAFFADRTREFARAWSGAGVDTSLVDTEALRSEWLKDEPDFRSALLLHSAWLYDRRHGRA